MCVNTPNEMHIFRASFFPVKIAKSCPSHFLFRFIADMVIALYHSLISNLHDQQSRFITHKRMLENPLGRREERGVRLLIYITIHATSVMIMETSI